MTNRSTRGLVGSRALVALAVAAAAVLPAAAAPVLKPPADPAAWPAWREEIAAWRAATRARLAYDDALYRRPEFAWAPSCFAVCFLMLCDETFLDREAGAYRVEAFLDREVRGFGGCDGVVLWHAYPRIGFDDRNQFDFYRDLPGGLDGLRDASRRFRARGVRVFVDYNPWDTGTRREGRADIDALADLVKAVEADGVFLDTMNEGPARIRQALDAARPGVVLESELALAPGAVASHHMEWAQWIPDGEVPAVLANKWLERRHLHHVTRRWDRDHSGELQMAWMNGTGILVWENVFGTWVGWNARDRSTLRAMLPIQRRFAALLAGEGWTPLVPAVPPRVYASLWEAGGVRLWTLVNRADADAQGALLRVPHRDGETYYDLVAGREIRPEVAGGAAALGGTIRARGVGAVVSGTPAALGADFPAFLASQAAVDRRFDSDTSFPARPQVLRPVAPTKKAARQAPPAGMAAVEAAAFDLPVSFRVRECGLYDTDPPIGRDPLAMGLHRTKRFTRPATVGPFAVDAKPVTNARFAEFLKASGYRPRHVARFLRHWVGGRPPAGAEDAPVVWVDLDDARAFAAWAGKRLPTEAEWFRAFDRKAAGWGTARVWEWTESERSDGRTRFAVLKGGADYRAEGSDWYADGGPRDIDFAAKFLLAWPGLDRCATIGFRCVVDLE